MGQEQSTKTRYHQDEILKVKTIGLSLENQVLTFYHSAFSDEKFYIEVHFSPDFAIDEVCGLLYRGLENLRDVKISVDKKKLFFLDRHGDQPLISLISYVTGYKY